MSHIHSKSKTNGGVCFSGRTGRQAWTSLLDVLMAGYNGGEMATHNGKKFRIIGMSWEPRKQEPGKWPVCPFRVFFRVYFILHSIFILYNFSRISWVWYLTEAHACLPSIHWEQLTLTSILLKDITCTKDALHNYFKVCQDLGWFDL